MKTRTEAECLIKATSVGMVTTTQLTPWPDHTNLAENFHIHTETHHKTEPTKKKEREIKEVK
jgi:hypothetical protein